METNQTKIIKITPTMQAVFITIGICLIVFSIVLAIFIVNFNIAIDKVTKENYDKGMKTSFFNDTKDVMNTMSVLLPIIERQIRDTNELLNNLKGTSTVVDEKMNTIQVRLELLNMAHDKLYKASKGGKK